MEGWEGTWAYLQDELVRTVGGDQKGHTIVDILDSFAPPWFTRRRTGYSPLSFVVVSCVTVHDQDKMNQKMREETNVVYELAISIHVLSRPRIALTSV